MFEVKKPQSVITQTNGGNQEPTTCDRPCGTQNLCKNSSTLKHAWGSEKSAWAWQTKVESERKQVEAALMQT